MQTVQAPREVVVLASGEGEPIWFLDNLVTIKASARDRAHFGFIENALPPGSRTPFHRHADEDEAFFVLEGELTVFVEEPDGRVGQVRLRSGGYAHVPRGIAHGFRTESAVRMLVVTGTDGFVEMVREMGAQAPRRELPPLVAPDVARLEVLAAKHRIELLGPLPE